LTFQCTGGLTVVDVQIEILYVPDCPNVAEARSAVQTALAALGEQATVREVEVTSAAEAERFSMRGSPTILVDGRDPFAGDAEGSVSCRLYRAEGGFAGAPNATQLMEVLSR
jgi:hypothetical protein